MNKIMTMNRFLTIMYLTAGAVIAACVIEAFLRSDIREALAWLTALIWWMAADKN